MKSTLMFSLVLAICTMPLDCVWATESTKPAGETKAAEDMGKGKAEIMKAWMEYSTPGPEHKILAEMVGKWKYTNQWWESADAKPQKSAGTSQMKLILGGRFLQHETKGTMMKMPFQGLGITGYDNIKKKFDTLWLDNMATGVMHGSGSFDEATHILKDSGEMSCPMSEKKTREYRSEWHIVDKKKMTFSMWGPGMDGKEFKMMEMVFNRSI